MKPKKTAAPPPAATWESIDSLTAWADNPRNNAAAIQPVADSIKRFGFASPILARSATREVIAGHTRLEAARLLGLSEVPVRFLDLSEAEAHALAVADNKLNELADWNDEALARVLADLRAQGSEVHGLGFGDEELDAILGAANAPQGDGDGSDGGTDGDGEKRRTAARSALQERFGVAPFTVLDARKGWWADRKRTWIDLGIRSELGRAAAPGGGPMPLNRAAHGRTFGQDLIDRNGRKAEHKVGDKGKTKGTGGVLISAESAADPSFYPQKIAIEAKLGRELSTADFLRDYYKAREGSTIAASGTSIFDPVLTELLVRWFSAPGALVLDPFAGGSVRGIVTSTLGRRYLGIDLRANQVAANKAQADEILAGVSKALLPVWVVGDSRKAKMPKGADLILTCPPYGDLEVYSDDPADISTLDFDAFAVAYREIIARAAAALAPDRFAAFVVGDYRDKSGKYRGLPELTVDACKAAGLDKYNEAILVTPVGSLPVRVGRQMTSGRKLGKTHQNVIVLVKGDPEKATAACGPVEFGEVSPDDVSAGLPGDEPQADEV